MVAIYRFMRTHEGITAFATIEVTSQDSDVWSVTWDDSASHLQSIYGNAVNAGVQLAATAHEQRGGFPQQIMITSLVETLSDTKPDAVMCATALALWKAWGYSELDTVISFADGKWGVRFS